MYRVVIDLEMCKSTVKKHKFSEVIELGAVLLDKENNIIKEFSTYVKPLYGEISPEVFYITHIKDSDIAGGLYLDKALNKMYETFEMDKVQNNYTLYTWSETDIAVLREELDIKEIEDYKLEYLMNRNTDIQEIFTKRAGLENPTNLENALSLVGLVFEGEAHGALIDAYNTARLLQLLDKTSNIKKLIEEVGNKIETNYEKKKLKTSLGSMIDFEALKKQLI